MPNRTLSLKSLNRTTLDRQLLLKRHDMPIKQAIDHLIGLQSQIPNPPYIGLWVRLQNFEKADLTTLIETHEVVRAAMMRSTLHLVTTEMHQHIQVTIQPALEKAYRSFFGKDRKQIDIETVITAAEPYLTQEARSTGELKAYLATIIPDVNPDALAYAVRTYLPLVQVPPAGTWGTGTRATYVPAKTTFADADLKALFKQYIAAFAPASVMDFQAFVGITNLKKTIEAWQDEFILYEHPTNGRTLYDLADAEIISEDAPVPIIFLPEYDNAVISYKDRDHILPDEHHKKVFLSAARVLATILIDGFVAATWKTERNKDDAILRISLFEPISSDAKDAIRVDGEKLLKFIEDDADNYQIIFDE